MHAYVPSVHAELAVRLANSALSFLAWATLAEYWEVGTSVDDAAVESEVEKAEVGEGVCVEALEGCSFWAVLECEIWEEGPTPPKASVLLDVMLGETCNSVGVVAACSEVKVVEPSVEDAGDATAVLLEPGRVSVSVNCTPLALSKGEDDSTVWPVFEISTDDEEVVLVGTKEITVVCAPEAVTLVGLTGVRERRGTETLGAPVLDILFGIALPTPVCENAPVCEIVPVVGSTTGTTDKTPSVLVAPAPVDTCCPKRLTASAGIEVATVTEEDRPTVFADALPVTKAMELVLVYRTPSCLGCKPPG